MIENVRLFARFYYRPAKAASESIDRGSIGFAICCLAAVMLLWSMGPAPVPAPSQAGGPLHAARAASFLASSFAIAGLASIFFVLVPVSVAVVAAWDGLGSAGVVLRREYVSLLICAVLTWSAAYLPFGLLNLLLTPVFGSLSVLGLAAAGHILYLGWFAVCLRTALGSSGTRALVATGVGWLASVGALLVWPLVGNLSYLFLSPWVLYLLYRYYSPDVRSLGDAMHSRRNFRRQLEAAMLNPRDADAHYQLGLIYEQRRQYEDAAASFRKAVEMQPEEADSHLHLGRVLMAQGNSGEALRHFEAALTFDPAVARHEGWRELGRALLDLQRTDEARAALERYTNQRAYDPEGLYYYGLALRDSGRAEEARQAFRQTVEAVQTAPSYRRGQLRSWASRAKSELAALRE